MSVLAIVAQVLGAFIGLAAGTLLTTMDNRPLFKTARRVAWCVLALSLLGMGFIGMGRNI